MQTVLHHVHGALGKVLHCREPLAVFPWCLRAETGLSRLQIIDLVPSASTVVMQVILNRMPHKRFGKETHQHFLNSVFRVAEAPQGALIRDGLLLGVIDRLLEVRLTRLRLPSAFCPSRTNRRAHPAGGCGDQVRGSGRP
jgi:hypothetical protein